MTLLCKKNNTFLTCTNTQTHIQYLHWSATTLKTLTGGLNNIDPLVKRQCCARNSWVHSFMDALWQLPPIQPPSQNATASIHPWQRHSIKAVASPAGQCTLSSPWRSHSGFTFPGFAIPEQFRQCSRAHWPAIRTCHCHDRVYFMDLTSSNIWIGCWEMVPRPFLWRLLSSARSQKGYM